MRRGDFIWIIMLLVVSVVVFCAGKGDFPDFLMSEHMYLYGFGAFFLSGLLIEALNERIKLSRYPGFIFLFCAALLWGVYGLCAAFMLLFYSGAVMVAQTSGLLPTISGLGRNTPYELSLFLFSLKIGGAVFSSIFFNLFFIAPAMGLRRFLYQYYQAKKHQKMGDFSYLNAAMRGCRWENYLRYELLRNIPFFWIPLYSLVFFYPMEMWVMMGAWLGLLLNIMLIISRRFISRRIKKTSGDR